MPKLSDAQRAWLERLRDEGMAAKRPPTNTACWCMRRGWTEWVYSYTRTKRQMSEADVRRHLDARRPWVFEIVGERITPAGRAALEEQNDER